MMMLLSTQRISDKSSCYPRPPSLGLSVARVVLKDLVALEMDPMASIPLGQQVLKGQLAVLDARLVGEFLFDTDPEGELWISEVL